ncbi:hypothetical protein A2673_01825 [Candidatus Kaiserbacteria bacterium RIFCSPHIGHO2_01_FULL_50_13]|uniref:VanZ-like domain-containing protein n=1 Tax=Candidatus Kaiserbacteria bacterium RIFCSPLOWO2_01_FULL_50_24 TaxID=1798507 RepID=A0A1F6EIL6_9BACT|nr:MAG: hypothetical protein A2673_01825 [Candidatus Kaiserbacteria bacterium RIFCSPHIGHO2_01_FULL_50_13]OGG73437.1 MAG: hypothetical protein A3A34_02450 [Candidatus Kaiserbacteria bacterium RIFCSPLOWO2_01_FULL_50_24]OGG81320.1 MAG: hypothetical protein A3H74_02045 [Candidatus Kaiserbacteria bacterium RIFCSPLOWO2_02_FULL_51_13]
MERKRLLYLQGAVATLVGSLHLVGLEHFLYWKLWWYDIPTHFLGGVWVALALLWVSALLGVRIRWFIVLLVVLAVGVLWELLEFGTGFTPKENYALDTILDLIMDVVGGVCGVWVVHTFNSSRSGRI